MTIDPASLLFANLHIPQAGGGETAQVGTAWPMLLAQGAQDPAGPFGSLFVPMILVMLLFYFMILRPQQAKQKKYQDLLDNLKENDQVVTNGGLYGVVTNVHKDAQRVTLRVDDNTGAKVRVALWAISHMANEEKPSGEGAAATKAEAKSKK